MFHVSLTFVAKTLATNAFFDNLHFKIDQSVKIYGDSEKVWKTLHN